MKRLESLAAAHPRVGTALSPDSAALRGQIAAIGFTPCDDTTGVDWVLTDGDGAVGDGTVPVLRLTGKISIYGLKQAVLALFDNAGK